MTREPLEILKAHAHANDFLSAGLAAAPSARPRAAPCGVRAAIRDADRVAAPARGRRC